MARRDCLVAAAAFALALVAARAALAQCSCSIADPGCGPPCANCTTQSSCCTCETQCAVLAPQCSTGYTSLGTQQCVNIFQSQRECETCATVSTGQCASCLPNYYGQSCQACPVGLGGLTCSGADHGQCNDGFAGNGTCSCFGPWKGSVCQFSDATTCSGHGSVGFSGTCTCATGFAGTSCNQCAANYVGYPSCGSICGDVNDDGSVDASDVTLFRSHLAAPLASPLSPNGAAKCTVAPLVPTLPPCDILDVVVIRRSIQSPPLAPPRGPDCPFVSP